MPNYPCTYHCFPDEADPIKIPPAFVTNFLCAWPCAKRYRSTRGIVRGRGLCRGKEKVCYKTRNFYSVLTFAPLCVKTKWKIKVKGKY
jgi:hypothetical protein